MHTTRLMDEIRTALQHSARARDGREQQRSTGPEVAQGQSKSGTQRKGSRYIRASTDWGLSASVQPRMLP